MPAKKQKEKKITPFFILDLEDVETFLVTLAANSQDPSTVEDLLGEHLEVALSKINRLVTYAKGIIPDS